MANPQLIEENPINLAQLKSSVDKIKSREEELNYRMIKLQEYLEHFVHLDSKKAEELYTKLKELDVPRFKEEIIHKVIDILPRTVDEFKVIMQGSVVKISKEHAEAIIKVVKDYI